MDRQTDGQMDGQTDQMDKESVGNKRERQDEGERKKRKTHLLTLLQLTLSWQSSL